MDRDRSFRTLAVIAVIVAVAGISVAFAALTQTLNISGTGTVKGNTWSVKFANLQTPTLGGTATVDTPASFNGTSTTLTYAVSLKLPGDSVTYLFDVTNTGTIDAKIAPAGLTLTGVTEALAANVTYTLTYANGTAIQAGDTLAAGATKNLKLVVTFNNSATELPTSDVELSLGASLNYIQQ